MSDNKSKQNKISREVVYTVIASFSLGIFIVLNFFISFNLYLYLLFLVFSAIFIFKKPEVGLYVIVILTFIFERFFALQPLIIGDNVYKIYTLDIITLITLISFFINYLVINKYKLRISRLGASILLFSGLCVLSTIYGILSDGDSDIAFSTLKNYAIYSVFFFLTLNIIRSKEQLKRFVSIIVSAGICVLFFVFYGLIQGSGLWIEYTPLSTFGARLLAPTHAFYLCLAILIIFNFLAYKNRLFGRFTVPIVLIQFVGVIGSLTRHLWIALLAAVIISFILLSRRNKKNLARIVAIQLLAVLVIVFVYVWFSYITLGDFPDTAQDLLQATVLRIESFSLSLQDESSFYRLLAWQEAWERFAQSPAIGIGFGQKLTFDYFGFPTRVEVRGLHNDVVGIGLQMGVVGLSVFVIVNIIFIRYFFLLFKKSKQEYHKYLLGFFACYILFIISANFGIYFDINLLVIFFWIILGLVMSVKYIDKVDEKTNNKK